MRERARPSWPSPSSTANTSSGDNGTGGGATTVTPPLFNLCAEVIRRTLRLAGK